MSNDDYRGWATRKASRGGHVPADPAERAQPQGAQPQTLPAPPPGFTWAMVNGQLACVPLQAPPPQAAPIPAPVRQPGQGVVPYVPQPHYTQVAAPGQPPAHSVPAKTCQLVKPGNRDPYAEMLATIPDLAPPGAVPLGPDGQPAPLTVQDLGELPEFQAATMADQNAYPRGAPTGRVAALGSVPVPQEPVPVPAAPPPAPPPPLEAPETPVSTRPTRRVN